MLYVGGVDASNPRPWILVVDDYEDWRAVLRALFEARGFGVEEAEDGPDALDKLERMGAKASAVVLDLMMPRMDGVEVLARLRERKDGLASVPVLLVTAASEAARARLDARACTVVPKPVQPRVLLDLVEEVISAR